MDGCENEWWCLCIVYMLCVYIINNPMMLCCDCTHVYLHYAWSTRECMHSSLTHASQKKNSFMNEQLDFMHIFGYHILEWYNMLVILKRLACY